MVRPEFLFPSINVVFWWFFARCSSTNRVLAQVTLPRRGCVVQAAESEMAPPSVLYGHNCIDVRCVVSGMAPSANR